MKESGAGAVRARFDPTAKRKRANGPDAEPPRTPSTPLHWSTCRPGIMSRPRGEWAILNRGLNQAGLFSGEGGTGKDPQR
jgi:hypothetical protein